MPMLLIIELQLLHLAATQHGAGLGTGCMPARAAWPPRQPWEVRQAWRDPMRPCREGAAAGKLLEQLEQPGGSAGCGSSPAPACMVGAGQST